MGYRELQGVLGRPVARIFLWGGAIKRGDGPKRPGRGGVGLSETGFRAF